MNPVFSFSRFKLYFQYDLGRVWRRNRIDFLLLSLAGVMMYLLVHLRYLAFDGIWGEVSLAQQRLAFGLMTILTSLFLIRVYGWFNQKSLTMDYLLLPASALEKTLSMLLIAIVIIPGAVLIVYTLFDYLLSVFDSSYATYWENRLAYFSEIRAEHSASGEPGPYIPAVGLILLNGIVEVLVCLACAMYFKKRRTLMAICVIFGIPILAISVMVWSGLPREEIFQLLKSMIKYLPLAGLPLIAAIYYKWKNATA